MKKPWVGWLYAGAFFFLPFKVSMQRYESESQRLASCWLRDTGIGIEREQATPLAVSDSPRKQ